MAYLGYCVLCNHLKAEIKRRWLIDYFIEHMEKSHSGQPYDFVIVQITAKDYQDYLKHKDNPKFWQGWNNKAKVKAESIPFFVKSAGRMSLFLKRLA